MISSGLKGKKIKDGINKMAAAIMQFTNQGGVSVCLHMIYNEMVMVKITPLLLIIINHNKAKHTYCKYRYNKL